MKKRNCNIMLLEDHTWQVMFCLDYEDQAIRIFISISNASSFMHDWCVNGRLPM